MFARLALTLALIGCAAPRAAAHRDALAAARPVAPPSTGAADLETTSTLPSSSASLLDYQRAAVTSHPEVHAAWSRWQAGVERIGAAARVPEPTLSYGRFVSAIETRVGPQRNRVAIAQGVPWPSTIRAGIDAAAERATAEELRFDATVHQVAAAVAEAYWRLWSVRQRRALLAERVTLEEGLLEAERLRVALGQIPLAALSRREIAALRLADRLAALADEEASSEAELRAMTGLTADAPVPTPDAPGPPRDAPEDVDALRARALAHPRIAALDARAQASLLDARQRAGDRLPGLGVSADWVEVGPARMDGVPDSGKDVFMVGVAVRVPIAARSATAAVDAARAEAAALRADADAAALRAEAELQAALARIRETARRERLIRGELLPRAEAAVASWAGVQAPEAATEALQARADLIEVRLDAAAAAADHAVAWARLAWVAALPLSAP